MNRLLRGAALAALSLCGASAISGPAFAQSYNRLVVFGDSLSDNGNLYLASNGTQPPSPYFEGRYSNGLVWTEQLGFRAANFTGSVTGSINLAYGGARTDDAISFPSGMRQQLASYTSAGGTFGAGDLVSVLGGANNIFQSISTFASLPTSQQGNPTGYVDPAIRSAVSDITGLVGEIASRGAGTILVTNLPRLGTTPQFRTTSAAGLADYAGSQFNGQLRTALLDLAPSYPDTNIILFDLAKVSDPIAANPGRFGLSNATDACFDGSSVCSDPDGYLYWDGVHPTAAGHRLIATLSADYLYYGDRASESTLQGETAFRHREDALDWATSQLAGRAPWRAGTTLVGGVMYDASGFDQRGAASRGKSASHGAQLGLESGVETLRLGLAGSWRVADVQSGPAQFEIETLSLDLYGGWRSGPAFLAGAIGVANEDVDDIRRVSSLAALIQTGSTRGFSAGARLQGGFWTEISGVAFSPRAALTWVRSEIDGYSEQGYAASYQYLDREVSGLSAEIGLRAERRVAGFDVFVEGGYRDRIDDGSEAVRVGIDDNPAQILSREFDDPFGGSLLASAGVAGTLGPFDLEVGYRGRFGDHADSHTGGVTLRLPLG